MAQLHATPAYQQGLELDDLRDHVATLAHQLDEAEQREAKEQERLATAAAAVRTAATSTLEDHRELHSTISELSGSAGSVRVPARIPDLPNIAADDLDDSISLPVGDFSIEPVRASIGGVQAAAGQRRLDVDEVLESIQRVDARQTELLRAEQDHEQARSDTEAARRRLDEQRQALTTAVDAWRIELNEWLDAIVALHSGADEINRSLLDAPDLLDRRTEVVASWLDAASGLLDRRQGARSEVAARRQHEQTELDRPAAELAELEGRSYPEPPVAAWQRLDRRACLADLIDFADHLADDERTGLEAALEAAGLLGAELGSDGALHLASGDLIACAGQQVDAPLSDLLTVTVPETLQPDVDPGGVAKLLASISTDLAAAAETVVTVTGEFRVGTLRGRHTKPVAEHVGVTARRAAIERRRIIAQRALAVAVEVILATDVALTERDAHIERLKAQRSSLPTTRSLDVAHDRGLAAAERLDDARSREADAAERVADRRSASGRAEC